MRGKLVWDTYAFVPSKAGLTKEVVFHEGGLSKEVLLYYCCGPASTLNFCFLCCGVCMCMYVRICYIALCYLV